MLCLSFGLSFYGYLVGMSSVLSRLTDLLVLPVLLGFLPCVLVWSRSILFRFCGVFVSFYLWVIVGV